METTLKKPRVYWGLLLALTSHAFLIGKALPYAFLPFGSTVYADRTYTSVYSLILMACLFVGVPLTLYSAFEYRNRRWNIFISGLTIFLCLATYSLPFKLQQVIGDARQLKTPCYPCDGDEDTLKGLYLVY